MIVYRKNPFPAPLVRKTIDHFLTRISTHCKYKPRCFSTVPAQRKKEFRRTKPHVNIGTIGHVDHGKTSLTSAITKVLSQSDLATYRAYDRIDNCPQEKERGITINAMTVEYETKNRHYSHCDCPGHIDFIKNMITGTFQMDGAVLVLAANSGVMPQTREHIILARQIGLERLVVFLNKADLVDESTLQLCDMEIREMLTDYGFDGDATPVIVGSAKLALEEEVEKDGAAAKDVDCQLGKSSIVKLLDALDDYIATPHRRSDAEPSLLSIQCTYHIIGRGLVVAGILEKGVLKKGDVVELAGFDVTHKAVVGSIETFQKSLTTPEPGDNIGVLIKGVIRKQTKRGMMLAKVGSVKLNNRVKARVFLLGSEEGGIDEPICVDHTFMIYSKTFNITANVNAILGGDDQHQMVMPGEETEMELMIMRKLYFPVGSRFTMRTQLSTIGFGVVTEVLDNADETMLQKRWKKIKVNYS